MKTDMKLEKFAGIEKTTSALKFGVIGLGQCGGKITDLFASLKNMHGQHYYETFAINTWGPDLEPLKNIAKEKKLTLVGGEGCGHKPKICEKLMENDINRDKLMNAINNNFKNCDSFIVCAGLAGGTGTGLLTPTINVLNYFKNGDISEEDIQAKPITAIVTIPQTIDTNPDKQNAVDELFSITQLLKDGILSSLIVIDNQKTMEEYNQWKTTNSEDEIYTDWKDYSNKNIVKAIHELNLAAMIPNDRNFDTQDMKNIFQDSPGLMTISKNVFYPDQYTKSSIVEDIMHCFKNPNTLADGYDLGKSRHTGYIIVKPRESIIDNSTLDELDARLASDAPFLISRPGTCITNPDRDEKRLIVYTIAKIAHLPYRVREGLDNELEISMQAFSNTADEDFGLAVKRSNSSAIANMYGAQKRSANVSNPFEKKDSSNTQKKEVDVVDLFKRKGKV